MPTKRKQQPIGRRLLKLRRDKKLTLKQVANETGLKTQYISQVEKGDAIPPVSVILQLSRALEIDSGVLLREEKAQHKEQSAEDFKKRTEAYTYETLTHGALNKHLKAFKISIDPESVHKGVSYQHTGEEFHYVLKGTIEVIVGENRNVLGPGDSLHFNSSVVHRLRNPKKQRAELLVVLYTP